MKLMKVKLFFMMKKTFFLLGFLFISFCFFGSAKAADSVTFHIRYKDKVAFEGSWPLTSGPDVAIQDDLGVSHLASSTSALTLLTQIDASTDSFDISQLQYFSQFASFYLNCVHIKTPSADACANWQYAVNNASPGVGMDKYILLANDDVWVYFGDPYQITLDLDRVPANQTITARAQRYDYTTNMWLARPNVIIGIIQPNSFPVIEIATSTSDGSGNAVFTLSVIGSYQVGVAQDFYFPTAPLIIVAATQNGVVSAGVIVSIHHSLDVQKALQFLINNQQSDGSFDQGGIYTDWAAIALAASEHTASFERVKVYLTADPSPGSLVTDYERRAMALEALGINPYSGTKTDYIKKILDGFDGKQFGDINLVNDDIFAIFPLLHAGFTKDDNVIKQTISFILSQQQADGSWIGGVDMTSAAVQALTQQALSPVNSLVGVSDALQKARAYLKTKQDSSGGFDGNVFSSSWALQAITALGETQEQWQKNNATISDYFFTQQAQDGGLLLTGDANARLWATSYAIPAALQKPWDSILSNFLKQEQSNQSNVVSNSAIPAPLFATSTRELSQKLPDRNIAMYNNQATSTPFLYQTDISKLPQTVLIYDGTKQSDKGKEEKPALTRPLAKSVSIEKLIVLPTKKKSDGEPVSQEVKAASSQKEDTSSPPSKNQVAGSFGLKSVAKDIVTTFVTSMREFFRATRNFLKNLL